MDTVQHPPRSAGHESGPRDSLSIRPRTINERNLRHGTKAPSLNENRPAASSLSRGFESMLKTTTETGDIGMFSIKPSRVHHSHTTPRRPSARHGNEPAQQKPRQPIQPYGVPTVDDRKRLPSYARDAASEVISMYETASQKSGGRVFDEPDCRSYSMTQTSYSSYTLSNHRSYASLRSQPETTGQLQRARSPFAYPARLKRPGFRPSSPALTDGGVIDYSRRTEIERGSQGPGYSTSSPSSLYAQRRKPNLPFRPEANRSTPSLLGQSSPPRRTSSPFVSSHNDISGHDWHRRTGPASMNTSPARSTFSLASTVNLCATVQPPSTATTPGKVPPSPLYYDYTEDFEVEVINPLVLDSPTPFRIDKTIPEDRPKSSGNLPSGARDLQRSADDLFRRLSHKESLPIAEFPIPGAGRGHTSPPLTSEVDSGTSTNDPSQDRKTFRLSGLGYGAQLLNSHVDEAFQVNPPSDLEIRDPNKVNEEGSAVGVADYERPSEIGNHIDQRSLRGFYSSARIPTFPAPPRTQALMSGNAVDLNSRPENGKAEAAEVSPALQPLGAAKAENNQCEDSKEISPEPIPSEAVPTASPINSIGVIPQKTTSESQFFPLTSSFSRRRAEDGQAIPKIPPLKRTQYYHGGRQLDYPATPDINGGDVPNFSHQLPGKDMARSESPMLAPKPISPARQLNLKNSIPQLMKALPALPPEPTGRTVSPVVESPHSEGELPSNFTPLPRFEGSALSKEKPEVPDKDIPLARPITVAKDEKPTVRQNEVHPSHNIAEEKSTDLRKADAASHLKLKLKLKSPSQRPMSPPDSRPWNLAENYPWTAQTPSVRLPSLPLDSDPAAPKPPPRFKLRVTRASQSTQGTVRVNRESTNARSFAGLPLGYPKDLFTPATGVDSIFRQVSKHFHSRRASATSNHTNQTHRTSASGPLTDLSSDADSPTSNRDVAHLPSIPAGHLHAPGARSVFSDDSSRVQGHHNLRKRLSHLKTRITHPYGAKTGAQSYDDITWKDRTGRNGGVLSTPSAARSIPNFHSNRHSTESKPMRRFGEGVQRQKLKVKVQGWLRGAKSKISARMRSRTAAVEMEADIPTKA